MRGGLFCLWATTVLSFHIAVAGYSTEPTIQWSEGEHLELGDLGASAACADLNLGTQNCPVHDVARRDRRVSFSYGELIAAADYYKNPEDLFFDRAQGIKDVIRCANRLRMDHPTHDPAEAKHDDCTGIGFFRIPGFLEIVSRNYDHFGWHNMKAYVRLHERALRMARDAYLKRTSAPNESRLALEQALLLNAFADHYLTDAFAAGHIRLPRVQLKSWARRTLPGAFRSLRGDLLAIILHESEGRDLVINVERGLAVKNARGDKWVTRGDQYLRIDANIEDPTFALPLAAVRESLREVLITWQTGEITSGVFRAGLYVPFHDERSLAEKLSPLAQGMTKREIIEALHDSLPFYQKFVLSKQDVKRMLRDLPLIFAKMRKDVSEDILADPESARRLPVAYIEAYRRID